MITVYRTRANKRGRFNAIRINDKGLYYTFFVGTCYKDSAAVVVSAAKLAGILGDVIRAGYVGAIQYC